MNMYAMMNAHEAGFLNFIEPRQRRRLRSLLELSPKRRSDVRALFDHGIGLDPATLEALEGPDKQEAAILQRLIDLGAPATAHVMSAVETLDGKEMPLSSALCAVLKSTSGALVSAVPGRLAYFQFEAPGPAFILKHNQGR